ncbi:TPA: hypothetical protein U7I83_000375 [Streptococcus agalactiae]|nr:hypothetical protein [Streptococcus agalactiae]
MIDENKLKRYKILGLIIGAVLVFIIGYGSGQVKINANNEPKKVQKSTSKAEKLTQKQVQSFLIAYYTKKDLEENRNRYKPFMTESMYNQEVSKENDSVAQAYKGYVVDFKLKESEIYIDAKTNTAIAKVRYTNTLLAKKNNYEKAQKNVSNEATLQLIYTPDAKGKLKLNQLQPALLTVNGQDDSYPDYGNLNKTKSSSESEGNSSKSE